MLVLIMICISISIFFNGFQEKHLAKITLDNNVLHASLKEYYLDEWPILKDQIHLSTKSIKQIDDLLASMTLKQKVGQMILLEAGDINEVSQLHIGNFYYSDYSKKGYSAEDGLEYADSIWIDLQQVSKELNKIFIPPFICASSFSGNISYRKATIFPNPQALATINDVDLTFEVGKAITQQFIATGINCKSLEFSADQFSEHPYNRATQIEAYFKGSQSYKHTLDTYDSLALSDIDFEKLNHINDTPFIQSLNNGMLLIGSDFSEINQNRNVIDTLRNKYNYQGLVAGNDVEFLNGIKDCWLGECEHIFNAGVDLIPFYLSINNNEIELFINNTLKSIESGNIKLSRIDDAVRRILTVKMHMGLFDNLLPSELSEKLLNEKEMLAAHKLLAQELVKKSVVLLKNNKQTIPMNRNDKILITGNVLVDDRFQFLGETNHNTQKISSLFKKYAKNSKTIKLDFLNEYFVFDSLMTQHYGIGKMKVNRQLRMSPIKTSIEVPKAEQIKLDKLNLANKTDVRYEFTAREITIFFEKYREQIRDYVGQFDKLIFVMNSQDEIFNEQFNLFEILEDTNIDIVVVYLAEQPDFIGRALNESEAAIMAWLPGSEIEPLMQLMFKDKSDQLDTQFIAKLSYTWPMFSCDFNEFGNVNSRSSLPFGFGLTTNDNNIWNEQNEVPNNCQYSR